MIKKGIILVFILLVSLSVYVIFLRPNLTLSKELVKEKYKLPNSHFLNWKGGEIHYTESGKGFPILMIHGFGGSNRDFYVLDSLLNTQYRVIRIDLPGFGLSDFPSLPGKTPDYIKEYDDYFTFLLDTLHIDSCFVMGNSLGGMMAWNLAFRKPEVVKKLILFNSAGYEMEKVKKSANAYIFTFGFVRLFLQRGLPIYFTEKGARRVFYDQSHFSMEKVQRLNALWNREGNLSHLMQLACAENIINESDIKSIQCPTLVVWGMQDKIISSEYAVRFKQDIPNCKMVIYDSCGHVPMLEKPNEVKVDVEKFLTE